MTYLCVDKESEYIADNVPTRAFNEWNGSNYHLIFSKNNHQKILIKW